jgi:hypothetical protein
MADRSRAGSPLSRHRRGRVHWSAIAFLLIFTVVALAVAYYAMRPAAEAAQQAPETVKRHIVAWFRLLLAVLLFILIAGLLLTFRFGRLFFPRASGPRVKTQYVDAWAESAKRLRVPPEGEDEE